MLQDTCPNCGHHKKPYMMSTRSDSSFKEILDGEDGPQMATIGRIGLMIIAVLILAEVIHLVSMAS